MGTNVYQVWRRFKDRIPVLKEFGIRWVNHIKLRKVSRLRQSNKCLLDPRCVQRYVLKPCGWQEDSKKTGFAEC